MSKLFKLKEWLTLREAAKHLSTILREEVSEADILRLCLDHRMTLSVVFVDPVVASICEPSGRNVSDFVEFVASKAPQRSRLSLCGEFVCWGSDCVLQVQSEVQELEDGCYDLAMMGGERISVDRLYWQLVDGAAPEQYISTDGAFVTRGGRASVKRYLLMSSASPKRDNGPAYYPSGWLPESAMFVVRTGALIDLERSIDSAVTSDERPLATTERNTLLKLVIGMAVAGYGYDAKANKSPIPKQIADDLSERGLNVSDDTVRKYLKEAASAFLPESMAKS